ncbi:unnamed protein product [Urochloa humidicola]
MASAQSSSAAADPAAPPPSSPWVILGSIPCVAQGGGGAEDADLSLELFAPPRVSLLTVFERVIPARRFPPVVLAADPSGLLLLSSQPDVKGRGEGYFVLDATTSSAFRLPDPGPKETIFQQALGFIACPGGGRRYMVAELVPTRVRGQASLRCYSSDLGKWVIKRVHHCLPVRRLLLPFCTFAHHGRLWWVDHTLGIITANPFADEPVLHLVPFPPCCTRQGLQDKCYHVGVSSGKLCFVYYYPSDTAPDNITVWTLPNPDAKEWMLEHQATFADIWDDDTYKFIRLPKKVPVVALIHPHNPAILHCLHGDLLFVIDLHICKVVQREFYHMVAIPHYYRIINRFMHAWELPELLSSGIKVEEYATDEGGPDTTGHQHDFGSDDIAHISDHEAQGWKAPQCAADEDGSDTTGHQHHFGSHHIGNISAAHLDHQVGLLDGNKVKCLQSFNTEEVQSRIVTENKPDGTLGKNLSTVGSKMMKSRHYHFNGRKVLLKTPSGFALFNVKECALKKDKNIWIYFADSHEARDVLTTLGFVKDDHDLCKLIQKFCKNEELVVEDIEIKGLIEKELNVSCICDGHTSSELIWGIKNVIHDFVPEEANNIKTDYCLPLSKELIEALKYYLINISTQMVDAYFISVFGQLCFMDLNLKEVAQKLRTSYGRFLGITDTIEHDLAFAKILAISLVPTFVDHDLVKTLSPEMRLKLEQAKQFVAESKAPDVPLHDIRIIMGSLEYLMHAPQLRDEALTRVKLMESSRFQSEFSRMLHNMRLASGSNAEQKPDIRYFGDHVDFKDLKFKRTLLETPSGFAIFDVRETLFQDPEHMWTCFSNPYDARNVAFALGFVKLDDKSVAWKHVTDPNDKLRQLILRFCKNKVLFVRSTDLKTIIESKLDIECFTDADVAGDLMWGLQFVLPDFIVEERGSLIDEYYLPLCKGLQHDLKKYKINLSPREIDRDFIYLLGHVVNLDVKLGSLLKALNKNFCDSVRRLKNKKLLRCDPSSEKSIRYMMGRLKLSVHLIWDPSSEKLRWYMLDLQRTCPLLPTQVKSDFFKSIACIKDICDQKLNALHELWHWDDSLLVENDGRVS